MKISTHDAWKVGWAGEWEKTAVRWEGPLDFQSPGLDCGLGLVLKLRRTAEDSQGKGHEAALEMERESQEERLSGLSSLH